MRDMVWSLLGDVQHTSTCMYKYTEDEVYILEKLVYILGCMYKYSTDLAHGPVRVVK
jgi:hypothetical protein